MRVLEEGVPVLEVLFSLLLQRAGPSGTRADGYPREAVVHIASIQITNYKSYRESSELKLTTGINIITGQNNAGKTALLEALSLNISDKPHRSVATVPRVGMLPTGDSVLRASFRVGQQELTRLIRPGLISSPETGVGQVLAMLYVVLNSDTPRTILIDEPQSFLHPGAVRKLIEIFKEYPQHQYILTTHSPTVIAAANPSTITLVTQRDGESEFEVIDPAENEQLRRYLVDIGARLSDAFGADDVLWVEGPTEEICFPILLEKVARKPLLGTAIIAVNSTGDLEGRHAKTVFEIYERLSKAKGLLPPAVGFLFDKEDRSEKQRSDIRAQSNGVVAFTHRRLYENYLLNPRAISAVVNAIDGFREEPVTEAEVKRHKYFSSSSFDEDRWRDSIHGAKLLERLFSELSETRVSYQKTEHSVRLTEWIAEHSPEDLRELADLLGDILEKGRKRLALRRS